MKLASRVVLAVLLTVIIPPQAQAKGKVYTIKGMGTHYTRRGKKIRKAKPRKRVRLVQLKTGPGFVIGRPRISWGTRLTVYQINRVMALYRVRFPKAPPVIIHDLSKRGGGVLNNHNSHVDGRDVDIPLILNPVADVTDTSPRTVNVERMWFIIKAFVESCDVEYMFLDKKIQEKLRKHASLRGVTKKELDLILQYPAKETERVGVVRHWQNHLDHVHIRFRYERSPVTPASKLYCDWKKTQRD